jgi:transcriptional regulator with XRE-family HTH domain
MNGPKRHRTQVKKDRVLIAEMYIRGKYQSEIASELGLTQQQISYDLKKIQKEWQKTTTLALDEYKIKELSKIDHLERTYWQEWEESKKEKITKTLKAKDADTAEKTLKTEERCGDPRYLDGVQWCIDQRCKLFGLHQIKINHTGELGIGALVVPSEMTPEEWEKVFASDKTDKESME